MTELAALPASLNGTVHQTKETPAQRLERLGPQAVRDHELLACIISTGKDATRAEGILNDHPKERFVDLDLGQIAQIDGISRTKAQTLIAAFELARRGLHRGLGVQPVVSAPGDTLHYLTDIKDQRREHFVTLSLNARNQVIHKELTSIGSLSSAIVHPREVFRQAVELSAASVILAHNHPSGDVSPSQDDINLTRRLVQAGEILGIDVLDHVIVGRDDFISLKERGLI